MKRVFEIPEIDVVNFALAEDIANDVDLDAVLSQPDITVEEDDGDWDWT